MVEVTFGRDDEHRERPVSRVQDARYALRGINGEVSNPTKVTVAVEHLFQAFARMIGVGFRVQSGLAAAKHTHSPPPHHTTQQHTTQHLLRFFVPAANATWVNAIWVICD